jgi:trans-aconitate methyltransferase
MSDRPAILTPSEYRSRAEKCRDMARLVPATETDFLAAAAAYEALADHVEAFIQYEKQVNDPT